MKRSDLPKRMRQFTRKEMPRFCIATLMVFGALIGYGYATTLIDHSPRRSVILTVVMCAPLFGFVIAYIAYIAWIHYALCLEFDLCCPHCKHVYRLGEFKDVLIDNCPQCGGLLFEPEGAEDARHTNELRGGLVPSREQLRLRFREYERRWEPMSVIIVVAFASAMVAFALVVPRFVTECSKPLLCLLIAAYVGLVAGPFISLRRLHWRLRRKHKLLCASCGYFYPLYGLRDEVLANTCAQCGQSLWDSGEEEVKHREPSADSG